jgi:hypothetical protein
MDLLVLQSSLELMAAEWVKLHHHVAAGSHAQISSQLEEGVLQQAGSNTQEFLLWKLIEVMILGPPEGDFRLQLKHDKNQEGHKGSQLDIG